MEDSILSSIKKLLGIGENDTNFDTDVIIHINTALFTLNQLGVGPSSGFSITDKYSYWSDFLGENTNLEAVKTFIFLSVKLVFDPPTSGAVLEAMKQEKKEYEWRLNNN